MTQGFLFSGIQPREHTWKKIEGEARETRGV